LPKPAQGNGRARACAQGGAQVINGVSLLHTVGDTVGYGASSLCYQRC
jgi:hypothetical protein